MSIAKDCLLIVLQYCDLKTLTTCLCLNKGINRCIGKDEICYGWDKKDIVLLATNNCDTFLLDLLRNKALNALNGNLLYPIFLNNKCYQALDYLLSNNLELKIDKFYAFSLKKKELYAYNYKEHLDNEELFDYGVKYEISYNVENHFVHACIEKNWDLVNIFLKHPIIVGDNPYAYEFIKFYYACRHGELDMVKHFLGTINPNISETEKVAIVHQSVTFDKIAIIQYLYQNKIIDTNTAIWSCIQCNWVEWLGELLDDNNVDLEIILDKIPHENYSLQILETFLSNSKTSHGTILIFCKLHFLVMKYADNNEIGYQEEFQKIILLETLVTENPDYACKLLLKLIQLNSSLPFFECLLSIFNPNTDHISELFMEACKQDNLVVLNLLRNNFNNKCWDDCLRWACYHGNLEMVELIFEENLLLDCNTRVPDPRDEFDDECDQDMEKHLREDARITPDTFDGNAFMCAIGSGNEELIQLLIEKHDAIVTNVNVMRCAIAKKNSCLFKKTLESENNGFHKIHETVWYILKNKNFEYFELFLKHEKSSDPKVFGFACLDIIIKENPHYLGILLEKFPDSLALFETVMCTVFHNGCSNLAYGLLKKFDEKYDKPNVIEVEIHWNHLNRYTSDEQYKKTIELLLHPRIKLKDKFLEQLYWYQKGEAVNRLFVPLAKNKRYAPIFLKTFSEYYCIHYICSNGQLETLKLVSKYVKLNRTLFDSKLLELIGQNGYTRILDFIQRKILTNKLPLVK